LTTKYISHPLIKPRSVEARLYQQLVYAKATKGNTLFVAPTALGKTVLCIMVAAHRLKMVGGKVMMLAPTRPLVLQHCRSFRKFMAIPREEIRDFSGTTDPETRRELWPVTTIAIATPQVVENDIRSGNLDLKDYCLMIFDEAHRALGNYSYVPIAKAYVQSCPDPLILGLTASPGNNEETVREVCDNLFITNIEVKSDDDPDVRPYVNPVEVDWRLVALPDSLRKASSRIREYLDQRIRSLREIGLIDSAYPTRKDLLKAGKVLGLGVERFSTAFKRPKYLYYRALMDYAMALKAEHAIEILETQGPRQTLSYMKRMMQDAQVRGAPRSTKSFVKDESISAFTEYLERLVYAGADHPKMSMVEKIVLDEIRRNPASRIIVFTNFRDTVDLIVERLSRYPLLRVTRFVGQSSRRSAGLTQREQSRILDLFRSGRFNVLVATSVAEEGLDIAEVQMVLFYDCTPSAIRNIQRRGRTGRKGAGRVVILITENTREEAYHWAGQSREKKMRQLLRRIDESLKKRQLSLDSFYAARTSS